METTQTQPLNPYQMKRAARIARLQNRADALAGKGLAVLARARQMASVIPFGQPIASNSNRQRAIPLELDGLVVADGPVKRSTKVPGQVYERPVCCSWYG